MEETFSSSFGARLKETRKALQLTQEQAAALVGLTREHWGRCERGTQVPGGEALVALAVAGADMTYLLTGKRPAAGADPALRPDEAALLDNYRHAPKEQQDILRSTSAAFAKSASGMKRRAA